MNRPNAAFPTFVTAWPNYYPGHTPEYYLNWWCQHPGPQVFVPSQHNCNDVTDYEELITEVPGVDGTTAALLGLWAQGSQSSYTVNYDVGVCDLLASGDTSANAALSDPLRSRPLLFGLPAGGILTLPSGAQVPVATYVGPAVCRVNFNNSLVRSVTNINGGSAGYSKAYIATTVFADFQTAHGHVTEAVNYYYDGPFAGRNCAPNLPQNSPVMLFDNIQVPGACVDGMEAYYMIDVTGLVSYDPRLTNGMTAWGGIDPSGNFNNSYWDVDHGWDGHGNFPPGPQFSFDSCSFVSGSTSVLSCQ